jgi:ATP-binding cassette subfamily B protein/subfamily B ATP-binding cassette protein MsbA
MFKRAMHYLWPLRRQWAAHIGLALIISGLQLLAPWPMKFIIDSVVGNVPLPDAIKNSAVSFLADDKVALLVGAVIFGIALAVLIGALNLLSQRISIRARQAIVLELKGDLFHALQHQSLRYHNDQRLGDLLYRINTDVWGIDELILTVVPVVVAVVTFIGMFSIVLYLNWQMAMLSLFVLPTFYYTYVFYSKHFGRRVEETQRLEGETISIVQEVLSALPVVKAFTREEDEHSRFMRRGRSAKEARVKLTTQQAAYTLIVGLITTAGTSVVLGFGAYQILRGRLTIGELLVIIAYLSAVYSPLESIYSAVTYTHAYLAKIARVFDVLDVEPEIRDRAGARALEQIKGKVAFENVSFGYGGAKQALRQITFAVQPGQSVGIVGATGAGKTSLASLVPRFYDPDEGRVCVDDNDVRDVQLRSLRRHIGLVLQEPILFSGTIRENIRYGKPDATDEEIIAAAGAANAHDFIVQLPAGYETDVGERGVKLSGGERQRISIARAFLKNAPILILDEPTSAVDYKTEATILEALERLMSGRTTFIIAHRLSTLTQVDMILVLQAGRIIETGTHASLLATRGLYYELHTKAVGLDRTGAPTARAVAAS